MDYKYDVSICMPYAEDWPHAYFTLNQCAALLNASHLTHELRVCANNSSKKSVEDLMKLMTATDFGPAHNARLQISDIPANGPAANTAASEAQGKYLCFIDSHVVLWPNIFTECIKVMERDEQAGLIHAPVVWTGFPCDKDFNFTKGKRCFQYLYRTWQTGNPEWYLHQHFHGTYNHFQVSEEPYPIAGCGHGFFMVRNDVWKKVGGYHDGQRGYGGREPFVTFKMWMMGYKNYTVPTTCHCHYNGARNYFWSNDLWYRNVMQQAYCTGGEPWLDRIYTKFKEKKGVRPEVIKRLRDEAITGTSYDQAAERMSGLIRNRPDRKEEAGVWDVAAKMGVQGSEDIRKFVLANQKYSLEDLFKLWEEQKVFF